MANSPHTTNPSDERSTPRDIVFDLEDDIGDLRRLGSTLRLVADSHGMEDVVQDALRHVAHGLSDCHRELHDKFKRLFEQIVRADTDTPEPANGFDAIFAAWYTNRKQQHEGAHEMSDDEAERLNEQELKLLNQLVATPATSAGENRCQGDRRQGTDRAERFAPDRCPRREGAR